MSLIASNQNGVIDTSQLQRCGLTSQAIHRRVRKRRRDRALAAQGFQVVRVTELDLKAPVALADEMKRLRAVRRAGSVGRLDAAWGD